MANDEVCHIPECSVEIKPYVGKVFHTLDDGERFYVDYARIAGFDARKSGSRIHDGVQLYRGIVCSREGSKFIPSSNERDSFDGLNNRRKRTSSRCGCKAKIFFKFVSGVEYVVQRFIEEHNHSFVPPQHKHFMRINRNIDDMHKKFIMDCAKANIGATLAYRLMSELLGGPAGVGCTLSDVRNFTRDLKAYVDGSDAQMLLDHMKKKKELHESFMYDYQTDNEGRLTRLFWCDPMSRRNYHMFGDVVAFDTTYTTNKYCMIFAPFTGKNNHGKPITFAAGLLSNEDGDSFSWLFQKFIDCMGNAPSLIITDQDLGMKYAVDKILNKTRHRWCMWHIMIKLADKVSKELHANEDFKRELNACVWSDLIEPCVFESSWGFIMERYGLQQESWFKSLYEDRKSWVPAYFRDFPMSGLVRTTSISECENSFFKRYASARANLLEFWMQYNHALDAQRENNERLEYVNNSSVPTMITKLPIEKHAGSIYTFNVFGQFQEEIISACFNCRMTDMHKNSYIEEYTIEDEFNHVCIVAYDKNASSYSCECKMFGRMGLLCRHIIFVFKNNDIRVMPDKYIVGRWLKTALVKPVHDILWAEDATYVAVGDNQMLANKLTSSFFSWLQRFDGNNEKMAKFLSAMDNAGNAINGKEITDQSANKKSSMDGFYGAPPPENIDIHPLEKVKTKGSGRRIVSDKEKAIRDANKALRQCKKCMQWARHDSRNCDKVNKKNNNEKD